ncbi:MAG: hypothetical protein LQ348_002596 [Seirophora lacunosa]|nr:MAG: hypothetical protein LQ348_002596 [Seirophora lacunosa]
MASGSNPLDLNRLSVSLDSPPHPRQVYLPGDSVQGYISLHNPYHASGLQASISFAGLSRVHFKETRLFSSALSHDDEYIAWRKANLACTKHHDGLIWNFQFYIPTEEHSRCFAHEESFSKRAADALTPTFCTSQIAGDNNLTHKKGEDNYAAVTYTLKADLAKPHSSHSYPGPTACQIPLPLSPIRLQSFHDLPPNVVSSSHHISPHKLTTRVLDQADYAHLGLPNDPVNAHKLFWKFMKPCLDVEVSIPKCAMIGRKLDVKLRIDHNLKQLPAEKLPQVILEAVRIELVSETRLRIPNGPRRDPQTKWTKMISYYLLNATRIPVETRSRKLTKSKANGW